MKTAASRRALLDSPVLMLPILLLAFALRVFHLGASAIWWDESLSLYRAMRDIPTILANTIQIQNVLTMDLQPPLYFLILHFLVIAFGTSEFALRFLSVAANVGSIALLFVLGRRWFPQGRMVGLMAAFLGALSPFWVWYAQEARPYTAVLFWSLLAVYALARSFSLSPTSPGTIVPEAKLSGRVGARAWLVTYILSASAALYTNYYAVFLIPFHIIYIISQTRSLKKSLLPALPALSAVLLLPIVTRGAAGNANSGPSFIPLDIILRDLLHSFSVGITLDAPQTRWIDGTMLILFLFGIVLSYSGAPFSHFVFRVMLVAFLLVPTLAVFALSYIRPLYQSSRYLIAWSPAFYLGVALGLGTLGRTLKPLALPGIAITLYGAILSFSNLYFDPHYAKDDHRAWAESLRERVHADDFLILDSPHTEELFNYYARGVVPYATLPTLGDAGATSYNADRAAVLDALRGNPRVWFLSMHVPFDDPNALIEQFLNQQGVLIDRENFRGTSTAISLSQYMHTLPTANRSEIPVPLNFQIDSHLRLVGIEPKVIGARILVKLFWKLEEPVGEDYGVSLRLVDAGSRIAQSDKIILGNRAGTSTWPVNRIIVDEQTILVAPEALRSTYNLEIQVYHSATGNGVGDSIMIFDAIWLR